MSCSLLLLPVLPDGGRRRRRRGRGQVVLPGGDHGVRGVHDGGGRVRRPPRLRLEGEPAGPRARHSVHAAEHHPVAEFESPPLP